MSAYGQARIRIKQRVFDDRGAAGKLLDIHIWQSQTTTILENGVVTKGLRPQLLDPARYLINPEMDLNESQKGIP